MCNAQYKVLQNFDSANGDWPNSQLTISEGILYGTTSAGGANGHGCIFSIDTSGNGYRDLFDFNGTNGNDPFSPLILSGKVLYGVTALGGMYNDGCIFSIDTNGNSYKDLLDFNVTNGNGGETSPLTLCANVLYGTTYIGGVNGHGRIFSIDTIGNGYRDLYDFRDTTGEGPLSLLLSGNLFYGVSSLGSMGYGSIFSIDTNGRGYRDLFDFNDTNGGPWASVILSGNLLYGAATGNSNYKEYLFSIDTNGSRFRDFYNLPSTAPFPPGPKPNTPLLYSRGKLYVITSYGGINHSGNIFSIDTIGNTYKDIFDFNQVSGAEPFCSLIISESTLFGVTSQGGTNSFGVVFKIDTGVIAYINNLYIDKGVLSIFPNPSTGIFSLGFTNPSGAQTIEVCNMLGEKVYNETLKQVQGDYQINLSSQANGVYLYRVLNTDGTLLGSGKIVIQK